MKDVMDMIAKLLAISNVDATCELDNDWTWIKTDTVYINELHSAGPLSSSISFTYAQEGIHIMMRRDAINGVDVVVDEEERPRLHVSTKAGHCMEFALIKEDEDERVE